MATIGIVNNATAGPYLSRRADDVNVKRGYFNISSLNKSSIDKPQNTNKYKDVVNVPTAYGAILIRFLVLQNTTSDLNIVQRHQHATSMAEVPLALNASLLGVVTPSKLLNFASRLLLYNQSGIVSDPQRVAGISG
ncbi:hypothetical protein E8E12_000643 [Didymella heteroderae]|uniref:Uncharacterized protein n=1 Tax=Didymella heteroderae TaxID=1769908 RepID=A0A9P4WJG5_9PLEO|nr:hypothetical protein E8E12_000643 [Didymella heteroderae]